MKEGGEKVGSKRRRNEKNAEVRDKYEKAKKKEKEREEGIGSKRKVTNRKEWRK